MAVMPRVGKTSSSWMSGMSIINHFYWIQKFFLTIKKVLVRDGINAEGETTVSKFTGIKNE